MSNPETLHPPDRKLLKFAPPRRPQQVGRVGVKNMGRRSCSPAIMTIMESWLNMTEQPSPLIEISEGSNS